MFGHHWRSQPFWVSDSRCWTFQSRTPFPQAVHICCSQLYFLNYWSVNVTLYLHDMLLQTGLFSVCSQSELWTEHFRIQSRYKSFGFQNSQSSSPILFRSFSRNHLKYLHLKISVSETDRGPTLSWLPRTWMCLDVASSVTGSAIPKMKHLPPQARGPFSESLFLS